jgi:hypothetical protein
MGSGSSLRISSRVARTTTPTIRRQLTTYYSTTKPRLTGTKDDANTPTETQLSAVVLVEIFYRKL